MVAGLRITSDQKPDCQRRVSTNRNYHTYRKIRPVVSGFRLTVRYVIVFPFRFISFLYLESTKSSKKIHCPLSYICFSLTISFQIHFVEFVSMVKSCWLVCSQSQFNRSSLFVSSAVPSTFTPTTSQAITLLDLPRQPPCVNSRRANPRQVASCLVCFALHHSLN